MFLKGIYKDIFPYLSKGKFESSGNMDEFSTAVLFDQVIYKNLEGFLLVINDAESTFGFLTECYNRTLR